MALARFRALAGALALLALVLATFVSHVLSHLAFVSFRPRARLARSAVRGHGLNAIGASVLALEEMVGAKSN